MEGTVETKQENTAAAQEPAAGLSAQGRGAQGRGAQAGRARGEFRKGRFARLGIHAVTWALLSSGGLVLTACGSDHDDSPPAAEAPGPVPGPSPTPAPAPGPSTVALGGEIERPWTPGLSDLQALPAVTQTVEYSAGSQPRSNTYTGTLLWPLIDAAGVKVDPDRKNDLIGFYVVARGSDDYRAVFSMGELMPGFGNRQSVVAYAEVKDGASGPLPADDGPLRVTSPGDIRGGRYVSRLAALDIRRATSTVVAGDDQPSTSFAVSGEVVRPGSFDLAALQALPAVTGTVEDTTYKGVDLWTFLDGTVGLQTDPAAHNPALSMYAVATGSDGYKAVVSLGEIHPNFGNQPAIIAYEVNGAPLDVNGFARLVLPRDIKAGRHVSRLIGLEVLVADK